MASIPDVDPKPLHSTDSKEKEVPQSTTEIEPNIIAEPIQETPSTSKVEENETIVENIVIEQDNASGVKASDDTRYRKYFKMLQFGVPPPAVKIKMKNEGFDPDVLE